MLFQCRSTCTGCACIRVHLTTRTVCPCLSARIRVWARTCALMGVRDSLHMCVLAWCPKVCVYWHDVPKYVCTGTRFPTFVCTGMMSQSMCVLACDSLHLCVLAWRNMLMHMCAYTPLCACFRCACFRCACFRCACFSILMSVPTEDFMCICSWFTHAYMHFHALKTRLNGSKAASAHRLPPSPMSHHHFSSSWKYCAVLCVSMSLRGCELCTKFTARVCV